MSIYLQFIYKSTQKQLQMLKLMIRILKMKKKLNLISRGLLLLVKRFWIQEMWFVYSPYSILLRIYTIVNLKKKLPL